MVGLQMLFLEQIICLVVLKIELENLYLMKLQMLQLKLHRLLHLLIQLVAGLMRGIGRFDQRGSISDALKQGIATTAFGAGSRFLGGADKIFWEVD
jgi:hypothetical protein